jgi:hypothetical protein
LPSAVIEEHYRPEVLATRLGLCRATVDRAIARGMATAGRSGIWPVRRIGRAVLVPASAADAWLRRGR